jgi:hypothetical protein
MRTISTGEPSNLETYRNIALVLTGNENSKAVKFIDKKIQESPNKEKEEVIADEREVIHLILTLIKEDLNDIL